MPPVAIGVVAHHDRQDRAERLADFLRAEVLVLDDGTLGAGANHRRCYEWLSDSGAPWSVIVEDDAIPVASFRDQLPQVLAASPTDVLSLYLGRSRPPHWQRGIGAVIGGDHHFLLASELLHHVAVAVRTPLIGPLIAFLDHHRPYRTGKLPIDEAVGRFCRQGGMAVGYTHPSIVDHDHTARTVIAHHVSQHSADPGTRRGGPPRRAWAFGVRPLWESKRCATIPDPS